MGVIYFARLPSGAYVNVVLVSLQGMKQSPQQPGDCFATSAFEPWGSQ
jgi:hypothetical protein